MKATHHEPGHILALIDAPDPDNFVLLLALARRFPRSTLHVVLTGRPLRFGADKSHALWDYDIMASRKAQQASAMRARNFMRHFGVKLPDIYDGGIAPRTLVPHHVHFAEYYRFGDVDPLYAISACELEPIEQLIREMLTWEDGSTAVVFGGPMTGLAQMMTRCPDIVPKIREVHAMFATWGEVALMDMGGPPRGVKQFNAACDPAAAHLVLTGLTCPIYLMPTEVTRVSSIGFPNAQALRMALPANTGVNALYALYALWYDAAILPRQDNQREKGQRVTEAIFIHDLVGAWSLDPVLREKIYDVSPIQITSIPTRPYEGVTEAERADYSSKQKPVPADLHWGEILMRRTEGPTNISAATRLKPEGAEVYLSSLYDICK